MQPRSVSVHGFYFSNTIAKDCVPAAPAGRGARGPGPSVPTARFLPLLSPGPGCREPPAYGASSVLCAFWSPYEVQ